MELSRNLRVDSVSRLGMAPPRQLDVGCAVSEAVDLMRRERVGCLLVTERGKLVGVFTERDLLARVLAPNKLQTTPLGECMTPDPLTVTPQDPVKMAIDRMQAGGHRHLPVVASGDVPVGILSAKRIVQYLIEHFPGVVYNLPPDPHNNDPRTPEGA